MHWNTTGRTLKVLGSFWLGERKKVAWSWIALIVAMLIVINVLNICISYTERSVLSSLEHKEQSAFWTNVFIYASIFIVGTPIVGTFGWIKNKMHMQWRDYLSQSLLKKLYNQDRFQAIVNDPRVTNPEQRIQQDADKVLDKLMTFVLALVDSGLALISFSAILWSLSPLLLLVAVVYSGIGTFAMLRFGRRMIGLHFEQETREADLRRELVRATENSTAIASYRGAHRELERARERLRLTLANWNSVISWNRNLTLFKVGYDYFILVVPLLITAPLYFAGEMDWGAMGQAASSFGRVLGALSVIVHTYMLFAELNAGAQRLVSFDDVLNEYEAGYGESGIETVVSEGASVSDLAVNTPDGKTTIIKGVNFAVKPGQSMLIVGPSGIGKSTVLKALAGLRKGGSGQVARPDTDAVMYLPQKPYMTPGTLRDQLLYPGRGEAPSDEELLALLNALGLDDLAKREGGLDAEQDWDEGTSGGQQQRIAIARMLIAKPKLAILDEATSGLDAGNERRAYQLIRNSGITTVSVAHREGVVEFSDFVLVIHKDGSSAIVDAANFVMQEEP
jgi:putative ATP-binding cassette transporter